MIQGFSWVPVVVRKDQLPTLNFVESYFLFFHSLRGVSGWGLAGARQ